MAALLDFCVLNNKGDTILWIIILLASESFTTSTLYLSQSTPCWNFDKRVGKRGDDINDDPVCFSRSSFYKGISSWGHPVHSFKLKFEILIRGFYPWLFYYIFDNSVLSHCINDICLLYLVKIFSFYLFNSLHIFYIFLLSVFLICICGCLIFYKLESL